jgi:hypothetical protein
MDDYHPGLEGLIEEKEMKHAAELELATTLVYLVAGFSEQQMQQSAKMVKIMSVVSEQQNQQHAEEMENLKQQHAEEMNQYAREVENLKQQTEEMRQYAGELDDFKQEYEIREQEYGIREQKYEIRLKRQADNLVKSEQACSTLQRQYDDIKRERDKLKQQYNDLVEEKRAIDVAHTTLQQQHEDLVEEKRAIDVAHTTLHQQYDGLLRDYHAIKQEHDKLEQEKQKYNELIKHPLTIILHSRAFWRGGVLVLALGWLMVFRIGENFSLPSSRVVEVVLGVWGIYPPLALILFSFHQRKNKSKVSVPQDPHLKQQQALRSMTWMLGGALYGLAASMAITGFVLLRQYTCDFPALTIMATVGITVVLGTFAGFYSSKVSVQRDKGDKNTVPIKSLPSPEQGEPSPIFSQNSERLHSKTTREEK